MPKPSTKPPAYRRRHVNGGERAYLTLRDSVTKRSKDYYLGAYGSAESRELYARLIAEWETRGRRLPEEIHKHVGGPTVTQLCHAYRIDASQRYGRRSAHFGNIETAMRLILEHAATKPAAAFGPNALRAIRQAMISDGALARTTVNARTRMIVAIFKWGVAHEIVPASSYEALRTIEPLRRGKCVVRETEPVRPVDEAHVQATLVHVRLQVRAMAELQMLTGMRPGEVTTMRTCDIETGGELWVYRPAQHKGLHLELDREIMIGPRAKRILKPWLRTKTDEYLFQPAEAVAELLDERHAARRTPMNRGNRPGTSRRSSRVAPPGECYSTTTYRRAIARACDQAFPPPSPLARLNGETAEARKRRLTADQAADLRAWQKSHRWHPHQLRHTYGTLVRKQYGAEAARIALGHRHVATTEIYAERDLAINQQIASAMG